MPPLPPTRPISPPEGPTFRPQMDTLLTRSNRIREDIRRLHPLLELLELREGDETAHFAARLLDLLTRIEDSYAEQVRAFRSLEDRLGHLDNRLALLLGYTD